MTTATKLPKFTKTSDRHYSFTAPSGEQCYAWVTVCGRHPAYHTFSNQPHWRVSIKGGGLLVDGHGTRKHAVLEAIDILTRRAA